MGWDARHSISCASDILSFISKHMPQSQCQHGKTDRLPDYIGDAHAGAGANMDMFHAIPHGGMPVRKDPWQPIMWLVALSILMIPITAVAVPVLLFVWVCA